MSHAYQVLESICPKCPLSTHGSTFKDTMTERVFGKKTEEWAAIVDIINQRWGQKMELTQLN